MLSMVKNVEQNAGIILKMILDFIAGQFLTQIKVLLVFLLVIFQQLFIFITIFNREENWDWDYS